MMKLCILGREPLDILEKWAREKFSAIKNTKREPPVVRREVVVYMHESHVLEVCA